MLEGAGQGMALAGEAVRLLDAVLQLGERLGQQPADVQHDALAVGRAEQGHGVPGAVGVAPQQAGELPGLVVAAGDQLGGAQRPQHRGVLGGARVTSPSERPRPSAASASASP
ncbi:hypothetical protein GCM10020000_12040 [Streptomyces olivoverticillatus]